LKAGEEGPTKTEDSEEERKNEQKSLDFPKQ
jgi:hypothetical protein